jgi:hypothetical protein
MIHRVSARPKLMLRPSFTPSEEVMPELEQNSASESQIETTTEEDTMKSTLREALLGPSIVAVALGSILFGQSSSNAQEANDNKPAPAVSGISMPDLGKPLQTEPKIDQPTEKSAFAVTAKANKTSFERGETPELFIEIQNITDKNATLLTGSGQKYDFTAYKVNADGEVEKEPIWKWSNGKMFTFALVRSTLAAGEKLSYKTVWPEAPTGKFHIVGLITANGGIQVEPFIIEVK